MFSVYDYLGVRRAGAYLVGREGGEFSPALFWKLVKNALILGKNALIVVIYGLNKISHSGCNFKSFQEKKQEMFPYGVFLFRVEEDNTEAIMKLKHKFTWDKMIERQLFVNIVTGFASPLFGQSPFIDIRRFGFGKNYFGIRMCNIVNEKN